MPGFFFVAMTNKYDQFHVEEERIYLTYTFQFTIHQGRNSKQKVHRNAAYLVAQFLIYIRLM